MLIPANKRISENAAILCRGTQAQAGYKSASPGGPAGSSLMTFAAVVTASGLAPGNSYVFNRASGAVNGWMIFYTADTIIVIVTNSTPSFVQVISSVPLRIGMPTLVMARYNNGTLQVWQNGVSVGTTVLGAGFTVGGVATMIGTLLAVPTFNGNGIRISECAMLDGYDVVASYNTSYGTGAAGIYQQWAEDLQQGRYLTWPRTMTVNDWYWSSRDARIGDTTKPLWVDRGPNAVVLTKAGAPQPCSVTTRYLP